MITIEKNGVKKKVALSAYRNFFAGAGWSIVDGAEFENGGAGGIAALDETDEVDEWADVDEEPTKPLSEMNREELERLAAEKGVSLAGLANLKQIREAIKRAL